MIKNSLKNTRATTLLILYGRIPSKKNSKIMICRGTRPILISNPKFSAWYEEQMWKLKGKKAPQKIHVIEMTFYAPDRRRTDLTNKAESIMDLLVDAGLIKDDNWFEIPHISLWMKEVDKKNPRVEISFY